jgi:hypothetical protein
MASIVVKIVRNEIAQIEHAKGVLEGAGFTIEYENSAASMGVDATGHDGDNDTYSDAAIIVGRSG